MFFLMNLLQSSRSVEASYVSLFFSHFSQETTRLARRNVCRIHRQAFDTIAHLRLSRRSWGNSHPTQEVVGSIHIGYMVFAKLEINAQCDRNVVFVLHPMGSIHGYMDSLARTQRIHRRTILVVLLVNSRIVVHSPKALQLFFRKNVAVILVEDADVFIAMNLKYEVTFTVDMVCRHSMWRRYEYDRILNQHFLLQVLAK